MIKMFFFFFFSNFHWPKPFPSYSCLACIKAELNQSESGGYVRELDSMCDWLTGESMTWYMDAKCPLLHLSYYHRVFLG